MPGKRRNRGRKKRRAGKTAGEGRLVRIPFRAILSVASTNVGAITNVAPTAAGLNIPRLTTASDPFEKYKFTSFKFRLLQGESAGVNAIVGYIGKTAPTANPGTLIQVSELGVYSYQGSGLTVHGNWASVPKTILRGMLPWYQTQGGNAASDTEEDNQGCLVAFSTSASTLILEVVGVLALTSPADPANSPLPRSEYERRLAELQTRLALFEQGREKSVEEQRKKILQMFPVLSELTTPGSIYRRAIVDRK